MSRFDSPLNRITVAAPCSADWDKMRGNERFRFCEQCSLNVYNLSAMSRGDAETLIMRTEGRLCVRYYRRTDGTILTNNCPVGLRALKRRVTRIASGVFTTLIGFFAGIGVLAGWKGAENWFDQRVQPTMGNLALPVAAQTVVIEQGVSVREPRGVWSTGMVPVAIERPLKIKKHKKSRLKSSAASAKQLQHVVERD